MGNLVVKKKIMDFIYRNPECKIIDIACHLNVTQETARKHMRQLMYTRSKNLECKPVRLENGRLGYCYKVVGYDN